MPSTAPPIGYVKRSTWLGVAVGWSAHLGLSALVPLLFIVAARSWLLASGAREFWTENTSNASSLGWQVEQAGIFVGSVLAGLLGAYVAPRRSWSLLAALAILCLVGKAFEQLPSPNSMAVMFVWHLAPVLGVAAGIVIVWLSRPRGA